MIIDAMDSSVEIEQMDRKSNSTKKRNVPSLSNLASLDAGLNIHASMSELNTNGTTSSSKSARFNHIPQSSQDEDSQASSRDSPIIFLEERPGNGVNGAPSRKKRKCAVPAKNSKKVAQIKAQKEKKEKPANRPVIKEEAPKRKSESKAPKKPARKTRKSIDDVFIELVEIKNKDALPVSKRLRGSSQQPTEESVDDSNEQQRPVYSDSDENQIDDQIKSPPKKRQRRSNGVKKAVTKPTKRGRKATKKTEEPEQEVQEEDAQEDPLLPESTDLTDDELTIDALDNSDDEGMDQESVIKKLREQNRKIKWDNLKLREDKIDLMDEVERLKAERRSHNKVCHTQKKELFDLRIENHELRHQNTDLMEKNKALERDNIAKTRSHEIAKDELAKYRTESQLKKQAPKIKQTFMESYVAPASQKANKSAGTLRNGSEPKKRGRTPKAPKTQDTANLDVDTVDEI